MTTAELHTMEIERTWIDGLRAIDEQYGEAEQSRTRWVRIGHGLLAGRTKCPSNMEFGRWLDTTGYRVIKDDERQDAMWMAVNAAAVLSALAETRIGNPSWARRHLRENMPTIYATLQDPRESTETSVDTLKPRTLEMPVESPPQTEDPVIPDPEEPAANGPVDPPRTRPIKVPPSLKRLPKGDLVADHFTHADAPRKIASWVKERSGRDVWNLMVQAIELGFAGPPTEILPTRPMLRAVLPWVLGKDHDWAHLDLTKPANRDDVRDNLFPLLQENPEFVGSDVVQQTFLRREWRQRRVDKENTLRRQLLVEEAERKAAEAKSEEESTVIVAYGTPLWPVASPPYTLQDLKCACWFTNMLMQSRFVEPGEKPKGTQLSITHLVKYIRPVALGFSKAVDAIANAYAANPTGESRMPRTPMAGEAEAHW